MIMSFQSKYCHFGRSCRLDSNLVIPVQDGLAITPSRMAELVEQGIPVSSSVLSAGADDGVSNPSWDIPIDQKRGVDVATVWESQQTSRKHITSKFTVKQSSNES